MFRREWRKKSFLTPEKTWQPLRKIVRNWELNLRAEEECELPIYSHQLMLSIYMIRDRRNVFDVLRDTVQRIMIWIIISLLLKKSWEPYLLWPCSSSNSPSIKISFQIRTLSWLYQANWPCRIGYGRIKTVPSKIHNMPYYFSPIHEALVATAELFVRDEDLIICRWWNQYANKDELLCRWPQTKCG